jgi:hypothetical protein
MPGLSVGYEGRETHFWYEFPGTTNREKWIEATVTAHCKNWATEIVGDVQKPMPLPVAVWCDGVERATNGTLRYLNPEPVDVAKLIGSRSG